MAQRNSRASVGGDEDALSFPSPLAPDKGATALDLVYQAADVLRGMEKYARARAEFQSPELEQLISTIRESIESEGAAKWPTPSR